ncbi:MAG TPA: carbohydrate ABC transporter permease [Candidatus Methylomirabilis sp.]
MRRTDPLLWAATLLVLAWCLGPALWQVVTSLKPQAELYLVPPTWLPASPALTHYRAILADGRFLRSILNSAIIASGAAAIALGVGAPAAFTLARLRPRGARTLLGLFLAAAAFPSIALVSPLFALFARVGILNTYGAVILPHAALALPLTVWLLTAYLGELPPELEEAAQVDGASRLGAFVRVLLPAATPAVATAGLLAFLFSWNEFLFALTFAGSERTRPATVAIALFPGLHDFPWGDIAAASLIVTLPLVLLVLVAQRRIVAGLTTGAVRG